MKQNRWDSPVVWIGTLTVALVQMKMLYEGGINWYTISTAVITTVIAFLMSLNNPENKGGF